jgi:hypothetical protein
MRPIIIATRPSSQSAAIRRRKISGLRCAGAAVGFLAAAISLSQSALADEGGVSFWLPGQFGSLASVPQQPGWSFAAVNYYTSVNASGAVAASREITIGRFNPTVTVNANLNLNANAELVLLNPSYVFASPVFGGQLAVGVVGIVGRNNVGLDGTLTLGSGSTVITRQGSISDSITGFGDLYPIASLRWNSGVNSWMTYVTGDIPVGNYDSSNLANLGIGHGAIDGGGGYTYFNPQTGQELSVTTGLTYNLKNQSTDYQNGIDWHVDWGVSQFLSKQFEVGMVGYLYDQLSCDSGGGDRVGCFKSRVAGIGPQMAFIIPAGATQAYLNFKTYWEFDAQNRPSGWNAWVTLSLSPMAQAAGKPIVAKN